MRLFDYTTFFSFILIVFFIPIFFSCAEGDVSKRIYDYQVERLLSGQSGIKVWYASVNSVQCEDSVLLRFELVSNRSNDSLNVTMLTRTKDNCIMVETNLGKADVSKQNDGMLFTDSLLFADGAHWIINSVTAELLNISQYGAEKTFESQAN